MINNLEIQGLKSIDRINIDFNKLNLLVGVNSSGKSTVIQSLLVASQNIYGNNFKFNGNLISLGDFREVRNFITNAQSIKIKIEDSRNIHKWEFFEDEKFNKKTNSTNCDFNFDKGLYYLSASRIGYMDTYEKNIKGIFKFGLQGEYCLSYFAKNKDKTLDDDLIKDNVSETLEYNVNWWLNYIVGAKLFTTDIQQTDRLKAQFSGRSGSKVRTKNIGSGLSYLISIIIMCLSMRKNETLIIENPEIHLHPKAQSRLTEFFIFISKANRQLIIETHSDHIFNGLRVSVANNDISDEDISINFLQLNDKNCTINNKIQMS